MDQTFGQKAVAVHFNPSLKTDVNELKLKAAEFIDACNDLREMHKNPEVKRMLSIAITECQTAQMWAVKAVTWEQ